MLPTAQVRTALGATTSMVLICTPNSPTGGGPRHGELLEFLAGVPERVLVLIDQAYGEFVSHADPPRPVELTQAHPRLVVTRTFSKAYGLAGLRVGYGIATPALADEIARAGFPHAVSAAAEGAALAALRHPEMLRAAVNSVRVQRSRLASGLRERGNTVVAGHGNFVWLPRPHDVASVVNRLARLGVLVNGYPDHGPRISVGTQRDTDQRLSRWPTDLSALVTDAGPGSAAPPATPVPPSRPAETPLCS